MITALYLAHLNPVTNAHVEIINELKNKADIVKIMPVIFKSGKMEINSKSFPFNFEIRKKMLTSIFGDSIRITNDYTFFAPFKKYMPPLLSPKSWELRRQILKGVQGDFFSYTGDKTEGYMLKLYRLKPKIGQRRILSATTVKENIYNSVLDKTINWKNDVPQSVQQIIEENWEVIKKFSDSEDKTTRVLGMKFPKEGWSE
ncbi:hypothetical protein [Nitrosarchaeum sp.]|uniref:hypothetical protein n=1 Tax=Nitrosarchaeum sp. TaxID=2026886 RepID=UPI00247ED4B3|nr:hypothetical protein [Nitrosarchaeum sp.]MCV0412010.1 hypothetical protein [Nitrosarchaeum sp.]